MARREYRDIRGNKTNYLGSQDLSAVLIVFAIGIIAIGVATWM